MFSVQGASGEILVNGRVRVPHSERWRRTSSYIQQDSHLRPGLTAGEAMTLAAHLKLGYTISSAYKHTQVQILQRLWSVPLLTTYGRICSRSWNFWKCLAWATATRPFAVDSLEDRKKDSTLPSNYSATHQYYFWMNLPQVRWKYPSVIRTKLAWYVIMITWRVKLSIYHQVWTPRLVVSAFRFYNDWRE